MQDKTQGPCSSENLGREQNKEREMRRRESDVSFLSPLSLVLITPDIELFTGKFGPRSLQSKTSKSKLFSTVSVYLRKRKKKNRNDN